MKPDLFSYRIQERFHPLPPPFQPIPKKNNNQQPSKQPNQTPPQEHKPKGYTLATALQRRLHLLSSTKNLIWVSLKSTKTREQRAQLAAALQTSCPGAASGRRGSSAPAGSAGDSALSSPRPKPLAAGCSHTHRAQGEQLGGREGRAGS